MMFVNTILAAHSIANTKMPLAFCCVQFADAIMCSSASGSTTSFPLFLSVTCNPKSIQLCLEYFPAAYDYRLGRETTPRRSSSKSFLGRVRPGGHVAWEIELDALQHHSQALNFSFSSFVVSSKFPCTSISFISMWGEQSS